MENRTYTYQAILFDTRSIQKYIFSSNRLKANIGASHLVDRVFDDVLLPTVRGELGADALDDSSWEQPEMIDWTDMRTAARVGYIGGGNALLLFRTETVYETLRSIVSAFTKKLLEKAPGLRTGAAIGTMTLRADGSYAGASDHSDAPNDLTRLIHKLKDFQNTVIPTVNVPYTGLTLVCSESGETANVWMRDEKEPNGDKESDDVASVPANVRMRDEKAPNGRFYAWEVAEKLRVAMPQDGKPAAVQTALMEKLQSFLPPKERENFRKNYAFPMKFDQLGQQTPKNDIAVVHIDGNNMGKKFQECKTLTTRIQRSLAIRDTTIAAFAALVQNIVAHIVEENIEGKNIKRYKGELVLESCQEGSIFLPIRPLVLGGDDMTFVCAAKVAVEFASFVIRHLMENGIDSCGGITIMNTSYPFFRGYQIAEELCAAAKKRMRESKEASCWLDFAILHGDRASTLAQFRAQEYTGVCGDLHFGPYRVDADAGMSESLAALLAGIRGMRKLPNNKVKELRRVLIYSENEQRQFLAQLGYLGMRLPSVGAWCDYEDNLWGRDKRTPYMDAIELMDYVIEDEEVCI